MPEAHGVDRPRPEAIAELCEPRCGCIDGRHCEGGIYEAFVEGKLQAPKHLARTVHDLYLEPKYNEFRSRTIWSLSNAFTSAFKKLNPIPQFKATAKLGEFLEARFSQSF